MGFAKAAEHPDVRAVSGEWEKDGKNEEIKKLLGFVVSI